MSEVTVKRLRWNGEYGRAPLAGYHVSYCSSGSDWGYPERGEGYFVEILEGFGKLISGPHERRSGAEDAAQTDYENRIMSALDVHAESSLLSLKTEMEAMAKALGEARKTMRNCRGAIESNQVVDKDVHGSLSRGMTDIDAALAACRNREGNGNG